MSTSAGDVAIDEVSLHDRVFAQGEDAADGAWEPLSETCFVPTLRTPRTLSDTEVLEYQARNGLWQVQARGRLEPGATWLSDGHLFVDGVDLGVSSPEDLSEADATYVSEAPHHAPCASEWVLVVGEGAARHARLEAVSPGRTVSFQGRLLEVGTGEVRATGEVLSRVVDTFERVAEGVIDAEVRFADGRTQVLSATPEHPFYGPETPTWTPRLVPQGEVFPNTISGSNSPSYSPVISQRIISRSGARRSQNA